MKSRKLERGLLSEDILRMEDSRLFLNKNSEVEYLGQIKALIRWGLENGRKQKVI